MKQLRSPLPGQWAQGWQVVVLSLLLVLTAQAQVRPYIGFTYPAGGQQGTAFQVRIAGQGLDGVNSVLVTGRGVTATVAEYYRRLNNEELQLLHEQLRVLRAELLSASGRAMLTGDDHSDLMSASPTNVAAPGQETTSAKRAVARQLIDRIERRVQEHVPTPACAALASLVLVDIAIAPDAEPGEREIRLGTFRGISNPLKFHVGQLREFSKKPMVTAARQVLGKEAQALRKHLPGEDLEDISLPCTVNGQIASGEVNRYRFRAQQGQHLVISCLGRQLVPFIADAVPGWFQPVLALYDADGREVAYNDDFRFKPDPTILFEVPRDGEYTFAIHDSLYRGREDFVYRITVGELPFLTSIFPLGGPADSPAKLEMKGPNLQQAELELLSPSAEAGLQYFAAVRHGLRSNRMPFEQDILPESFEQEPNNTPAQAQSVTLPVIINGRIDKPDDWDVFRFAGKSNDCLVAEVHARRLDSPLDSVVKLTDEAGRLLGCNDDHEDLGAGINTHQADSYLSTRLPADGFYCIHIGDTARQGGSEYAYRLRLSAPRPDFALWVVPSSLNLRLKSSAALTIYAQRKDGFDGSIQVALTNSPRGFSASPVTLSTTQCVAQLKVRASPVASCEPVALCVVGSAEINGKEVVHRAVPAEDRMQAFLWRQLVPAQDLRALAFHPTNQPPLKRNPPVHPPTRVATATNGVSVETRVTATTNDLVHTNSVAASNLPPVKPKFTRQQIVGRVKQIKALFQEGMLTDEFYLDKLAECEAEE